MHALVIFHLGGVGGPSRSLEGLASWLAETGSVTALFPEEGGAAADYRAFGDVAIASYSALTYARRPRELARSAAEFARDVSTFRRELRRLRPDLVVVVTTVLPAALVSARLERVPAVVLAAELYDQGWKGSRVLRLWGALLARATARLAAGVVCCSRAVADQFPARLGDRLAVAYPPIDGRYAAGDRSRGRDRYGLRDAAPGIAVVGNLSRGRGQDVALRALARMRRQAPHARLLIEGEPHPRRVDLAYATELRALAHELGVADAVVFCERADVADVYAAADVVVNPARSAESFGRVAAEALMAGRPPVTTDGGAVREVIRDGVDGLIVAPDRPDDLADAVLRLWRDRDLAARLVASGRARVMERFGVEQDLAAWQRVLAGLAPPSGRKQREADRPERERQ